MNQLYFGAGTDDSEDGSGLNNAEVKSRFLKDYADILGLLQRSREPGTLHHLIELLRAPDPWYPVAVFTVIQALPRTDPGYEASLINNIYDRRTEYVTAVRNRAVADHRINDARGLTRVINIRYPMERADALRMMDLEYPQ